MNRTSTTELKALYDFSMIHTERMKNVGKADETQKAEHQRNLIYNELLKRIETESSKLQTPLT